MSVPSLPTKSPAALGIDLGGTSVKCGVVRDGVLLEKLPPIPTAGYVGPEPLLDAIAVLLKELQERHADLATVGFGAPGMTNHDTGIVYSLTNIAGWKDVPLRELASAKFGLPVSVENDAKCMTYAEWRHGAGRGKKHLVCVTLGTGIGGGLVLDGKLYRGAQLTAGEIGMTSIDWQGLPFVYGNSGSIEAYTGNHRIAERAVEAYAAAGISKTQEECMPANLSLAADDGDKIAAEIWESTGVLLGVALSNVVWLLNPEAIVLGGGVAAAGERLFAPIRRTIHSRTLGVIHQSLEVVHAELGNDAGIIGSAALALDDLAEKNL